MTSTRSDAATDERLWALMRAVASTGEAAWKPLLVELEPLLSAIARRQPIGRLRDVEDSPNEIVTRVIARMHAHEFGAIKKLCGRDPAPPLGAWLRVLVRRAAIDYMRDSPEFRRGTDAREPGWISLASLSSGDQAPQPDSLAEKRKEVLRFLTDAVEHAAAEHAAHGDAAIGRLSAEWKIPRVHARRVIARGPQYLAVLVAVLEGRSYPDVAEMLGITRREVELTVRYIEELLRERNFR
jgi:DNA-directed RNA polymerase specialized sigma24 family protein